MAHMAEEQAAAAASPGARPGADWRILAWWGVAISLLALTALFWWLVLAPWLQVRAVISDHPKEAIAKLGGPARAIPKLVLYARLPDRLAPV